MYFRKLFFLIILIFICDKLLAVTFTVTSNADSGPGTLRQALLDAAANGTTPTDYIYFNLPGNTQASITITVLSQLPVVTANVVIDGTTQPGAFLGVSNAKVIITPATPTPNLNAFNIDPQVGPNDAVEFYGLYIEGFGPGNSDGSAIYCTSDCMLVVGAPGRGNVICGNYCGVYSALQNAIVQSNFFGVEPDGETPSTNEFALTSNSDYNNLLFGGTTIADGNVVLAGNNGGIVLGDGISAQPNKSVTIENNNFGTDYQAAKTLNTSSQPFIQVNDSFTTLSITSNVFSATEPGIAAFDQATILVKGNYFGTDKTKSFALGSGTEAIEENNGINATIGGTNTTDQNVFTGYYNPITANNSTTNVIQNQFYCNQTVQLNDPSGTNYLRITTLTATTVSGDAPPGATVQLYYSTVQCATCNPDYCFATVTANASGFWQYTGTILLNVMASSTVGNNTYGFMPNTIAQSEVTVTNLDCHHPGSLAITENRTGNFQFIWTDSKGNIIGTNQTVGNLQAGTYSLQINEAGTCPSETGQFTITDLTPHVFPSTFQLDCSSSTAHFTAFPSTGAGISVANYYWENAQGMVIGTSQSIDNLAAGNYYLYITDSNGCNSAKAEFQVLPAIATPVIDSSKVVNTAATCNQSNGSITGITISNAAGANYGWSRPDGTELEVGQLNLTNVPAGIYYFFIDYNFNCPPIKSQPFVINSNNVIVIDLSAEVVTSSTCSNSNGSIQGITATGATEYQWFNSSNNLVGSTPDLLNVPSGNYYLVASNGICTQQSPFITINNIPAVSNFPSTFAGTDATCNQSNGGLSVTFDPSNAPVSYRWTNSTGANLISNGPLINLAPGTYNLYVTDNNGCESLYNTYTVAAIPVINIVQASAQISDDQCSLGAGSIKNITVNGGVPPYTYNWFNSAHKSISTSLNISGLVNGVYNLQVRDATNCGADSMAFTVGNTTETIPEPLAYNLQLCSPGEAILLVVNPQVGYGYRLYTSKTDTLTEFGGVFKLAVTKTENVYLTQFLGSCESQALEVNIVVGSSGVIIPNTFTPNNDGINDLWVIKGLESYPDVLVQVFNRYGQKVFESKGYTQPFDGKFGSSILPAGVYYYIINLNSKCSLLSGSLTIIR